MINKTTIEQCPILKDLSQATKALVMEYGVLKQYKKNEYIFHERDEVKTIFIVLSGYAVVEKVNKMQDRKVIFVVGAGEVVNEVILEKPIASVSCYALSEVHVIYFLRSQILTMIENNVDFSKMLIDSMAKKIRRLYRQLENTSNMMRLDKQIAAKLWKLGNDFGREKGAFIEIPFELTITFLADMLGSKRETISRIIKKMTIDHILKFEKNHCYIYDMEKLRKIVSTENG